MITKEQMQRIKSDMKMIAKSNTINVRVIKQVIYVFGSELEVLRLFAHYLANGAIASTKFKVDYSKDYESHFFTFELNEIAAFGLSVIVRKKGKLK